MKANRIITATAVVGLAIHHLEKTPEPPRNGHPVTEQRANIAEGYSVKGSTDVTDTDDRSFDSEMSI